MAGRSPRKREKKLYGLTWTRHKKKPGSMQGPFLCGNTEEGKEKGPERAVPAPMRDSVFCQFRNQAL